MNKLIYILGFLALITWIISVQVKEKKNILLLQALANSFYVGYYYLLNLFSTSFMNMISVIRCLVFAKKSSKKEQPSYFLLIIFIVIISSFGILYCKTFLDFLPIIATILYTISGWIKSNKILRYTYIFCACIFFYYNYTVEAYIPLIGNIGEIISGTIALLRFRNNK